MKPPDRISVAGRPGGTQPPSTFTLDCDGQGCIARATFDSLLQAATWLIQVGAKRPDGHRDVVVLCPRCRLRQLR